MQKTILYRLDGCVYSAEGRLDQIIFVISEFLTSDVLCYCPSFKQWALSKELNFGGNVCGLYRNGDIIELTYDFDETNTIIKMTTQNFIAMLDQWEEICKKEYPEILLSWDGDKVTFASRGNPEV